MNYALMKKTTNGTLRNRKSRVHRFGLRECEKKYIYIFYDSIHKKSLKNSVYIISTEDVHAKLSLANIAHLLDQLTVQHSCIWKYTRHKVYA